MTLVGLREEDSNRLPIMLSVQHHGGIQLTNSVTGTQGHHHHHHHHHHHRGNVIVTASNAPGSDGKTHGCKRTKMYTQATPYGTVPHQPASVAKRNARERNRVKQVNNGFATLRQHIPQSVAQALGGNTAGTGGSRAGSKKLSKVETLRMAVEYIRSLQRLLDEHDGSDATGSTASGSHGDLISETGGGGGGAGHRLASSGAELHRHLSRPSASPGGTTTFAPPPCSEASSSPTPSFVSETSSAGSQGYGTASGGTLYAPHSDAYDNYEPMSPEDEELLDVISWWQQSQ